MKKGNKLIRLFVFALIGVFGFTGISNVNAKTYEETLVEEPIPNIYYTRRGGGKEYMSAQYNTYTMNGKVVYCVEPGISITTNNYIGEDGFMNSPYNDEINKKIELIGHYGYDYPGHKTLRYRIATQALIWETTGGQIVEWWTKQYGYGDYLSYDKEKKEIMKLVNAHYNKPSFDETLMEVEIGREYKITDTNKLLSEYELYKLEGLEVRIEGNDIYFTPTKTGDLSLSVKRKQYDNNTTIVFKGDNDNSQKMGYFRFSEPVIATLNLKVSGGQVEILKKGEKFIVKDGTFNYEKISLKGIKFNIYADEEIKSLDGNHLYYNKGDLVDTVITDEKGYVKSKEIPFGKYCLIEVETNNNYVLDTKKYQFELNETDNKTDLVYHTHNVFNYMKKGTLEFSKVDYSTSEPIPNVEFKIYTEKDELIYSGKTDENGKIIIKELAVGKYYIAEENPIDGYVSSDEKVLFEIKENGEIVKAEMTNKKISSTLKITKNDEDGNLLSGVKFGVYDLEDKLIIEHTTDENGYLEVVLEYGKYYFKEISTLDPYVKSDEKVYFEVVEAGAVIEKSITNDFKTSTLEFTKTDLITGDVIPNTVIEIYTEKDELIFTGKTDENGKIVIKELKYGKYYIVEKEAPSGFVITDEKVYFEIKEDGEIVKAKMKNKPIFGTLEFNKIDISTSAPLPNTVIEIYTEKDELIFTGKTDENGKIVIENLRYGKYYILEKEPPKGYILNEEKMYFEIKEDGEIVKTTMTNETIKIPNTLKDFDAILIPIGVLICGTIIFVISKKERKK